MAFHIPTLPLLSFPAWLSQTSPFLKSTHSGNLTIWLLPAVFVASLGPNC